MNSELLTIDDICQELGIGKSTAYKLVQSGAIRSAKIGKRVLVTKKALKKYIHNTINNFEQ